MQCWIELSRGALLHNYGLFVDSLGKDRVVPVLKSNAYGHGLPEIYEGLKDADPLWLAVTYTSEARLLRKLGYKGRLLNVGPIEEEDLEPSSQLDIEVFLASPELLEPWCKTPKRPKIHIKVDTGLSRRGFSLEELEKILPALVPFKNDVVGLATHLANVEDASNTDFAHLQLNQLLRAWKMTKATGLDGLLIHSSSSASALLIKEPKFDLNRIGISLYGLWPSEKTRLSHFVFSKHFEAPLRPVLSWKTKISSTRIIQEGDFVGYGCAFKAAHRMKIGVIPIGYFEGYPRLAVGRGAYVLVHGRRCPIVGRICMNMAMIDLDNSPQAAVGDMVTLIGRDGKEEVNAEQVGQWADTINYEIVTRLNPEIPRLLKP
jgi:alanine racemase